ncbi:MAG: hypothetical protein ACLUHE_14570 [Christensenellales bacterium]
MKELAPPESGVRSPHAMPGDDRFPVHNPTLARFRALTAMTFESGDAIVCGHGHNPSAQPPAANLTLDVVGRWASSTCMTRVCGHGAVRPMLHLSPGQRDRLEPCVARV